MIFGKRKPQGISLGVLAAEEGFEPSQTESESGVLPLHNSAKRKSYYNAKLKIVKRLCDVFPKNPKKIPSREPGERLPRLVKIIAHEQIDARAVALHAELLIVAL